MISEPVSVTDDRSGHTTDGQGTSPTSCPPDTVADLLIVDSDEDVADGGASWRESSSSIEDVLATHCDTHLSDCDDYEHTAHTVTDIKPSLPPKTGRLKSANNVPALPDYSVCGKQPLHYTNLSLYDHEIATLLPAKTSVSHGKAASVNNRHPVNWLLTNSAQRAPTGGLTDDDSHMTFPPLPLPPLTARQHEKTERQRRGKSKHSKTVVCHYDYYMEPALCSCDSGPLSTCCYHGTGPTAHSQLADDDLGLPHYPALPHRSRGSLALTSMQLPALHSTGQHYMAMKFAGGLPASKVRTSDPKAGYMSMDAFKTESGETSPTRSVHRDLSLPLSVKQKIRRSKTESKSHYLDMGKSADDSNIAKVKASDADHLCLVIYRNTSDNDDNSGDSKYGSTGDNSNRSRSNSSGAPSQLSHTDEHSMHRPFDDLIEHQPLACRPDYTLHSPTRTPTNSSRRYTYCVTSPASLSSSQQLTVTANSPSPARKSTGEGFFTRLWRRASGSKAKSPTSPEDVRKPKTKHMSFINRKSKSKSITNLIGRLSTNDLTRDEDKRMLPSARSEAHLYTAPSDTRAAPSHLSSSCAELQMASQPCQPHTVISGTADVGLADQFPALSMRRIHSAPGSGYMHSAPSLSASTHSLPSPTPTMPALPPKTRRQQTLSCLPEVDTTDSVHDDTNMPCDAITLGKLSDLNAKYSKSKIKNVLYYI